MRQSVGDLTFVHGVEAWIYSERNRGDPFFRNRKCVDQVTPNCLCVSDDVNSASEGRGELPFKALKSTGRMSFRMAEY